MQAKKYGAFSQGISLTNSESPRTGRFGRLEQQVVIVTGASGGLGAAVAKLLAANGATVALIGRDAHRLQVVIEDIKQSTPQAPDPLLLPLDVRDEDDMNHMAESVIGRWRKINALVACAGIARGRTAGPIPYPVHAMPCEEWDDVIGTNLRGIFLSNRAVLPQMILQCSGAIINVSSFPAGVRGQPFAAAYCASKSAVAGLTEALASEVRHYGILVQCLFPGLIDTPLIRRTRMAARGTPMYPVRVAELICHVLTLGTDVQILASRSNGYTVLRSASSVALPQ